MTVCEKATNRLFLTNNYSIVSKYSAIKLGYFHDKLLESFIERQLAIKSWRRTPLVNRGYAARMLAIDWIVGRSMEFDAVDCFIVLGAGYDTLPFRKAGKCCWIEIDLPQVVETKSEYIRNQQLLADSELIEIEAGIFSSSSSDYHLISCDLRDIQKLSDCIEKVLKFVGRMKNVAIINEVCLCYIEPNEVNQILKALVDAVRERAWRLHYIGYEQVVPNQDGDQFGQIMLDHFNSLGHPLKYLPTPNQIRQLFCQDLKFNHVTVGSMYQIYHNALLDKKMEISAFNEEPFDEFEEMDLYLSHYALVTGVLVLKDPFEQLAANPTNTSESDQLTDQLDRLKIGNTTQIGFQESCIRRFGHSSCLLEATDSRSRILVSGGFGTTLEGGSKHRRINDCTLITWNGECFAESSVDLSGFPSESICLDRVHGQVCKLPKNNILFFNGGRQSPSQQKPSNVPFIASLDDNDRLVIEHKFKFNETIDASRWRHKLVARGDDEIIQIGGIPTGVGDQSDQDIDSSSIIWNLSSSRLGFSRLGSEFLDRHSFGLATQDLNTLLIFGGLSNSMKDRPVDFGQSVVCYDLRESRPIKLNLEANCYGANVHFISRDQFIRIGGISTKTGLTCDNSIDIFDLRNLKRVNSIQIPNPAPDHQVLLTNATTCCLEATQEIITIGGGGNYFTFGTYFNPEHLVFRYAASRTADSNEST